MGQIGLAHLGHWLDASLLGLDQKKKVLRPGYTEYQKSGRRSKWVFCEREAGNLGLKFTSSNYAYT